MGDQRSLWEADEGRRLRDEAIDRVEDNTAEGWMDKAVYAVKCVALQSDEFTTDDVRMFVDIGGLPEPHEPRAWGAVMRRAIKSGLVVKTGEYLPTIRPEAHRRPIPVYRRAG